MLRSKKKDKQGKHRKVQFVLSECPPSVKRKGNTRPLIFYRQILQKRPETASGTTVT